MSDPNGTHIPDFFTSPAVEEAHPRPFAWVLDMKGFVKTEGETLDRVLADLSEMFGIRRAPAASTEFQPRRHSMPPQGASACSTSSPEIVDELAGRGLVDHSGRAVRKPIHFGDVHGSNHDESLRKFMETPGSGSCRAETFGHIPLASDVPSCVGMGFAAPTLPEEAEKAGVPFPHNPINTERGEYTPAQVDLQVAIAKKLIDMGDRRYLLRALVDCAAQRDKLRAENADFQKRNDKQYEMLLGAFKEFPGQFPSTPAEAIRGLRAELNETKAALQGAREARDSLKTKLEADRAARTVPDSAAFRELRQIVDCPRHVPLAAHVRQLVTAYNDARGELATIHDSVSRAVLTAGGERVSEAVERVVNAKNNHEGALNAITSALGFGTRDHNRPFFDSLARHVAGLVKEKDEAVEALRNYSTVLQRVRELSECKPGESLVRHIDRGMVHYRSLIRHVAEATRRAGAESGFLLAGIDVLKEKAGYLQAEVDALKASEFFARR